MISNRSTDGCPTSIGAYGGFGGSAIAHILRVAPYKCCPANCTGLIAHELKNATRLPTRMRLFPHNTVRKEQDTLLREIHQTIGSGGQLVVHAPTGLGKTAAALAPAIEHALESGKCVLFLTSRLTQHALALQTVQAIAVRHSVRIPVVDLIGKKHMCLQRGVEDLSGKEFADYCRALREDGLCEYYERLTKDERPSTHAKEALRLLEQHHAPGPSDTMRACEGCGVCPYEITVQRAKDARVIITDYSYAFNPKIREGILRKIGKSLQECIVIVDEGHNLPERIVEMASERISAATLRRAQRELEQRQSAYAGPVAQLAQWLDDQAGKISEERHMGREELLDALARITEREPLLEELDRTARLVREEQKTSSCGTLAQFLEAWDEDADGYVRVLARVHERDGARRSPGWQLTYRCLDPRLLTAAVFGAAASSVVMSGTLTPPEMYAQLLGLERARTLILASPFPERNRLSLIVPRTTTRYAERTTQTYEEIARICSEIAEAVPGNVAIFLPSYAILEQLRDRLTTGKIALAEQSGDTREQRERLLVRFRASTLRGAVLLAVMSGSFSEGIDLPGNELRAVIVVGLPLARPDLETKAKIAYYDRRFGKGWEWGYTMPAFNRTLQSAGRCIRTETDRGALIFLDERYAWEQYVRCFPPEWGTKVSLNYVERIESFFSGDRDG
jgi:DNA excision repair protein ERCC-2